MAQKVTVVLTDDLDPTMAADETVSYTLDGKSYEIDLSNKNADTFRGLFQDYIAVSRKAGGRNPKTSKVATDGPSAAEVRAWGKENGFDVPDRGRIPANVREAFDAAP